MSDPDRFQLRRLEATDYQKRIFRSLTAQPDVYYIAVIEDTESQKVVGSASLVIEQKFLRNGGKCGHIEDVVVDSACRGHRLGLRCDGEV
ncbi:hypothetical protein QBZ16_003095 [Prototheca wickerhamii]|uniref:Glucosamine 6-phosphate N-acetyltransferase n=1 Tax=Prototheca wickerhamii TaxID=3111 RepID=A0AAD9ILM0_PROWI|nr:hypothetical protein QBZ16_003095 [Prototheca wickerhamii]